MAVSTNPLVQKQTLISKNISIFRSIKPRFLCNSQLSPQTFRIRDRFTVSASAATDFTIQKDSTKLIPKWEVFARHVSGEWDGYGAEFTSDGKPVELPEAVVPEAFREWDVKVFDWQTQCPTLAEIEEPILIYKSIKLLPTVGCEADAATRHTTDERHVGGTNNEVSAFAYTPQGSYVAVWPVGNHDEQANAPKILELEHCLVDPRNRESRVRLIHVVQVGKNGRDWNTTLKLQNIKVFCEQWYGPFRNGEQLGGCSISGSAFASTDALKDSEVVGEWEGPNLVASFQGPQTKTFRELVEPMPRRSMRDQHGLVLLPRQLWCILKETKDGDICEAGWVLDQGHAMTSRCIFLQDGTLKEIAIGHETSTSRGTL